MYERLYTIKEARELLGVKWTIQQWDRQGRIRCVKIIGGRRRILEGGIKLILELKGERLQEGAEG